MTRLRQVGFKEVGKWILAADKPGFVLNAEAGTTNLIYVFVTDEEILYIGKTTQSLKKRMYGYQNPGPTQYTNISGRQNILEFLKEKRELKIYALTETNTIFHSGIKINLAAGIEDSLIREFRPKWNKLGK